MKKNKLIMKLISDLYSAKEHLDAAYDEISLLEQALDIKREHEREKIKQEIRESLNGASKVPVRDFPIAG